jgi:predicted site-specific integrase-resolvase
MPKTIPSQPVNVQSVLTTRKLAEQNAVSIRTVERWTDAGILPQPMRINGRKFWPANTKPKLDAPEGA